MTATTYSALALNARADALTRLLDGGSLSLLDRPGRVLARLAFAWPAFLPAVGGVAVAHPMDSAPGLADGRPAKFEARTRDERLVFSGVVGADVVVDGDDVHLDGEVCVAHFRHAERA